jgi:dihydroorotate dehydrogenase (NAD+) catalytic subunit
LSAVDLKVKLGKLTLKNPVLVSSGTFGYGREFADFYDVSRLGGIVTKAITPEPRAGNPPPRTVETPSGMLNAIGLENCGLEAFIKEKLPYLKELDTAVIVNVAGATERDYVEVVGALSGADGVDAFEINISCPNVKEGGIEFGTRPAAAESLIGKLRAETERTLIVKLSPNAADPVEIARAAEGAGADALSLVNTFRGMAIDPETGRPVLGNRIGGLSGPAIKPLALYHVYQVSLHVNLPVIGMGGIFSAADAMEFIYAGADAVSVGTANLVRPAAAMEILDGIKVYCEARGIAKISDCVGRAHN